MYPIPDRITFEVSIQILFPEICSYMNFLVSGIIAPQIILVTFLQIFLYPFGYMGEIHKWLSSKARLDAFHQPSLTNHSFSNHLKLMLNGAEKSEKFILSLNLWPLHHPYNFMIIIWIFDSWLTITMLQGTVVL